MGETDSRRQRFFNKGIRISLEAEQLLGQLTEQETDRLLQVSDPFLSKEDVEKIIHSRPVEVRTTASFQPVAKEYDADMEVIRGSTHTERTKGETEDFIQHFRNRYERLARLLQASRSNYPQVDIADLPRHVGEKVRIIAMVYEKRITKKGNLFLEVEDLTGRGRVIISSSRAKEKLFQKSKEIVLDDTIAISGKVLEPYIIAEEVEWAEIPVLRERKRSERDLAAVYISDTHFGSRYFLHKYLDRFVEWIRGKGEARELAAKVKYLLLAGDVVDGVGVYPNHIKELSVPDIYKQYAIFDDFIEKLPDHIEVVIIPGNHDAVRRAEPMPWIDKDLIHSKVTSLGNPAWLKIEGLKHVLYHGTSLDSMIANIPNMSYTHPEKVMVEYVRRRHLSPIYGGNLIVPARTDFLVLEEEPDILHCGHVHKNGYANYRNTILINSGTFQDRTDFQIRQGHVPTPGIVPVYEFKHARLRTLDFRGI